MAPSRNVGKLILGLFLFLCCLLSIGGILLFLFLTPKPAQSPALVFPTRVPSSGFSTLVPGTNIPPQIPSTGDGPKGKIAYVCQIFKLQPQDQICIINADGTGQRRLTTKDTARHFYPSIAPDGKSVLFSSNLDGNFKLYELTLSGELTPLGNTIGIAPEFSPDGKQVVFANSNGQQEMIWVMNRNGSDARLLYAPAWDPTWSPDGNQILFATNVDGIPQLAVINIDGSGFHQITELPYLRGRSDWSADGAHIVTYSGKSWERELYMMDPDGSNPHIISPVGGNSQGPSFSPDGQWVVFTAYFDSIGNNNGCEIYIVRIDGTNLTRLTQNTFCDWQPRWGP